LLRERDRLRDRVVQLEQAMADGGMMVPAARVSVDAPVTSDATAYPGEVGLHAQALRSTAFEVTTDAARAQRATPPSAPPDFRQVLTGLFAPPPPVHIVVLHVRGQTDADAARNIAADLIRAAHVRVILDVLPHDQRPSGYAYFDGRQSGAAAALIGQFNDIARRYEVAPWTAQLRGVALPAQGEYSADRVDLVLPALPPPPPPPPAPVVTDTTVPATATPAQQ